MVPYDFLVSLSYDDLPKQGTTLGVMTEKPPGSRGLLVKGVMPSSNAERGGIHQGDIMISIDGETLDDHLDLVYAMNKKKAGSRTKVEIERKGEVIKLEIVLGQ
jgi:S1-C subfamily serine protease